MRGFTAFLKKELCEMLRTYKVLIFGTVFFILGVMNPLTAKYTPDLMEQFLPEGMNITFGTPQVMDSWAQFFKNVPQIGLIVLVIVFSGMMASEWSRGTLVLILTKGLGRKQVILAKFAAASLLWTVSYWFCFGISYGYTRFFWEENVSHLGAAAALLWIFGIMLIAVALLGGVITKSSYAALLFVGILIIVLFLLNIVPDLQKYNPLMLAFSGTALLDGTKELTDFAVSAVITVVLAAVSLIGSILIFNKKQV